MCGSRWFYGPSTWGSKKKKKKSWPREHPRPSFTHQLQSASWVVLMYYCDAQQFVGIMDGCLGSRESMGNRPRHGEMSHRGKRWVPHFRLFKVWRMRIILTVKWVSDALNSTAMFPCHIVCVIFIYFMQTQALNPGKNNIFQRSALHLQILAIWEFVALPIALI